LITAITRIQVADYVSALIWIYTILILIRILLSWVPRMPANPVLAVAVRFVEDVTEPYLAIWRRIVPTVNAGGAGLDLSPIIAIFVLSIGGQIVVNLIHG
jgi:YggT family protein